MNDSINDESARWVARSDAGLTPAEEQELEAWLAADSRHRGAYIRAQAYWVRLDRFAALSGPPKSDDLRPRRGVTRRWAMAAGAAAAVAVGVGISVEWLTHEKAPEIAPGQRYSTRIGELKRIVLDDGSVLLLNTASEALVRFDGHQRNVELLSGEALFQVAHDRLRPFVVDARTVAVRALGTEFSVKLGSSHVDLTVTEGAVQLQPSASPSENPDSADVAPVATLSALQQATISSATDIPQIRSIDSVEVARELAWRQGMLWFVGQSLKAAVSEINRYNRRQIIIDDLDLAGRPVVGVFSVDDLDGFAAAAAAVLRAKVMIDGDAIRLESTPESAPQLSLLHRSNKISP